MDTGRFIWDSKVRDYELDALGMVNNATFIHYFEQCRNDYARAMGIDFIEYYHAGYSLVVAALEVKYGRSLRHKDEFYVSALLESFNDKRILFAQEIRFKSNDKLAAKALVHVACVDRNTGKSCMPDILRKMLPADKYIPIKK